MEFYFCRGVIRAVSLDEKTKGNPVQKVQFKRKLSNILTTGKKLKEYLFYFILFFIFYSSLNGPNLMDQ